MNQCKFELAWTGRCKMRADKSGYCDKHKTMKCRCRAQATHECEHTCGQFVCRTPLCSNCKHNHPTIAVKELSR